MKIHNFLRRLPIVCLMLVVVGMPLRAHAAKDFYLIQSAVNTTSWTIEASVVTDTLGWTAKTPLEGRRFGDYIETLGGSPNNVGNGEIITLITDADYGDVSAGTSRENLPLTFPGTADSALIGVSTNATVADFERATTVKNALLYDLQLAIDLAYPDRRSWTMDDFKTNIAALLTAAGDGGTAENATFSSVGSQEEMGRFRYHDSTVHFSDYKKVTADNKTYFLLFRMPKGYVLDGVSYTNARTFTGWGLAEVTSDVAYANWDMLVAEAVLGYFLGEDYQVTVNNFSTGETNDIDGIITGFISNLMNSLRNAMSLWPIEGLVFNEGARGTSAYAAGVFPSSWEGLIWGLFMVMEVIALILLMWVIIQAIAQRAMSTVNFMGRLTAWQKTKDLLLVGLGLALLPLFIQLMFQLSANLTIIFSEIVKASGGNSLTDMRIRITNATGGIGGIVIQFLLMAIDIYYNFVYVLRGLTVAVLIILSPLLIVLSATGRTYQGAASAWFTEITANIFIQPLHALIFATMLSLPTSTRAFENILMIFATIPFTLAIKKIMFPGSQGVAESIADSAKQKTTAVGMGALGGTIGGVASGVGGIATKGNSGGGPKGSGGGAGGSGGNSGGNTGTFSNPNKADSKASKGHSSQSDGSAPKGSGGHASSGNSGGGSSSSPIKEGLTFGNAKEKFDGLKSNVASGVQNMKDTKVGKAVGNVASGAKKVANSNAGKALGRASMAVAGIAGGVALGAAGGAMAAAGMGGAGREIQNLGKNLTFGGGQKARSAGSAAVQGIKEMKANKSSIPTENATGKFSGANPLYSRGQSHTTPDGKTNSVVSKDDLASSGVTNAETYFYSEGGEDKKGITYDVKGDSDLGVQMGNYNEMLQSMPPEERSAMVEQTGFDVQPIMRGGQETGDYKVWTKPSSNGDRQVKATRNGGIEYSQKGDIGNMVPEIQMTGKNGESFRTTPQNANRVRKENLTSQSSSSSSSPSMQIQKPASTPIPNTQTQNTQTQPKQQSRSQQESPPIPDDPPAGHFDKNMEPMVSQSELNDLFNNASKIET